MRISFLPSLAVALLLTSSPEAQAREPGSHVRVSAPARAQAQDDRQLGLLKQAFEQVARESGGELGVQVVHAESGISVGLNAGSRFPMMSVFKLPIALTLLHEVDTGKLRLDQPVRLSSFDARPGVSPLASELGAAGTSRTIGELLKLMIVESDNSACDRLLAIVGGPPAVNRRLRALGVRGISVELSELEMWKNYVGLSSLGPKQGWSLARFDALAAAVPAGRRRQAAAAFADDPRNTATPEAMVVLARALLDGTALSPRSSSYLLRLMAETRPAAGRIKGLLPPGTTVAHRPGTSGSTDSITAATNDIGIVTLPRDLGHLVIAVFLKNSNQPVDRRERSIARIARIAYDQWAPPARSEAPRSVADIQIRTAVGALFRAYLEGDRAEFDALVDPAFILTLPSGRMVSKEEEMSGLNGSLESNYVLEGSDLRIRSYDDARVAIVTGRSLDRGTYRGKQVNRAMQFTQVWLKKDLGYSLVAEHLSLLPDGKTAGPPGLNNPAKGS